MIKSSCSGDSQAPAVVCFFNQAEVQSLLPGWRVRREEKGCIPWSYWYILWSYQHLVPSVGKEWVSFVFSYQGVHQSWGRQLLLLHLPLLPHEKRRDDNIVWVFRGIHTTPNSMRLNSLWMLWRTQPQWKSPSSVLTHFQLFYRILCTVRFTCIYL